MSLEIIKGDPIKPSIVSEEEYDRIENLFSQGMKREEVIREIGWDRNWYYRRLKVDPKLRLSEQKGFDSALTNIPRDVAVGIRKSLTGHVVTTSKRRFEIKTLINKDGDEVQERVLVEEVEEDKYFPPNASTLNLVAKQIVAGIKDGDESAANIDEKISEMSDEDIKTIAEITRKQLKELN